MMEWLDQLDGLLGRGVPAALVSVAAADGSTPREAGAKMIVTADGIHGTIGGGNLELKAIEAARAMLDEDGAAPRIVHFALGPSLGQCCGGNATLLAEPVATGDWVAALKTAAAAGATAALVTVVEGAAPGEKTVVTENDASGSLGEAAAAAAKQALGAVPTARLVEDPASGAKLFVESFGPPDMNVVLFGAGHVGRAIVQVLSGLSCRVTWIDDRAEQFPAEPPANVETVLSDAPYYEVEEAPPGSFFLLMTHSHDLDYRIAERILKRGDFRYFGMIGSDTKRRRFEAAMRRRGMTDQQLARMTSPIGIAGITAKRPADIAVAVAAELLLLRDAPAG